jgi:hypothetical protein
VIRALAGIHRRRSKTRGLLGGRWIAAVRRITTSKSGDWAAGRMSLDLNRKVDIWL